MKDYYERIARIEEADPSNGTFSMTLASESEATDGHILSIEGGAIPGRMPLFIQHWADPTEQAGSITEPDKQLKHKPPRLRGLAQIEMDGVGARAEVRRDLFHMVAKNHVRSMSIRWRDDPDHPPVRRINLPSDHPFFIDPNKVTRGAKYWGYYFERWLALEGSIVGLGADPEALIGRANGCEGEARTFWRAMAGDAEMTEEEPLEPPRVATVKIDVSEGNVETLALDRGEIDMQTKIEEDYAHAAAEALDREMKEKTEHATEIHEETMADLALGRGKMIDDEEEAEDEARELRERSIYGTIDGRPMTEAEWNERHPRHTNGCRCYFCTGGESREIVEQYGLDTPTSAHHAKALELGVSADALPELDELARRSAEREGITFAKAFDDLLRGLAQEERSPSDEAKLSALLAGVRIASTDALRAGASIYDVADAIKELDADHIAAVDCDGETFLVPRAVAISLEQARKPIEHEQIEADESASIDDTIDERDDLLERLAAVEEQLLSLVSPETAGEGEEREDEDDEPLPSQEERVTADPLSATPLSALEQRLGERNPVLLARMLRRQRRRQERISPLALVQHLHEGIRADRKAALQRFRAEIDRRRGKV